MKNLLQTLLQISLDPVLRRLVGRMDRLRSQAVGRNGSISSTATLYASTEITNLLGNPEAIVVGDNTHIRGQLLTFWEGGRIRIGNWCYVGDGSRIWSQESITIGNYVLIAHLVDIHDTNSHPIDWQARRQDAKANMTGRPDRPKGLVESRAIEIADDVWIGFKCTIMKGVKIGRGAIVAAGSVVTHDVDSWTVVGGNPARVLKSLNRSEIPY